MSKLTTWFGAKVWMISGNQVDLLVPDRRDQHLVVVTEAALPLLKRQRLTCRELLEIGRIRRRRLFEHVDAELLWRALTYAERRRYVARVTAVCDSLDVQWDLTQEGETQISLTRILANRAKYGVILGLIGVTAAVFGTQEKTTARVVLAALAFFACWFFVQVGIMRALQPWAMPRVREREEEVQRVRRQSGIDPWWPDHRHEENPGEAAPKALKNA